MNDQEDDLVLTPGGKRPSKLVQRVAPGQVVRGDASGTFAVLRASDRRTGSNLVLTPGGFRHPSLVHRIGPGQALHFATGRPRLLDLATQVFRDLPQHTPLPGEAPGLGSGWIADAYWLNATGQP